MMFNWLLEPFGPSLFTKGVLKYQRKEYQSAHKYFSRAIKWCPQIFDDPLVQAYMYLTEYRLGDDNKTEDIKNLFPKMTESEYKEFSSYTYACEEMKILTKKDT